MSDDNFNKYLQNQTHPLCPKRSMPVYLENLIQKDYSFAVNLEPRSVRMLMVFTTGDTLISKADIDMMIDYYQLTYDDICNLTCDNRAPMLKLSDANRLDELIYPWIDSIAY